eukprot:2357866-Rhodomonas_salina.2
MRPARVTQGLLIAESCCVARDVTVVGVWGVGCGVVGEQGIRSAEQPREEDPIRLSRHHASASHALPHALLVLACVCACLCVRERVWACVRVRERECCLDVRACVTVSFQS